MELITICVNIYRLGLPNVKFWNVCVSCQFLLWNNQQGENKLLWLIEFARCFIRLTWQGGLLPALRLQRGFGGGTTHFSNRKTYPVWFPVVSCSFLLCGIANRRDKCWTALWLERSWERCLFGCFGVQMIPELLPVPLWGLRPECLSPTWLCTSVMLGGK